MITPRAARIARLSQRRHERGEITLHFRRRPARISYRDAGDARLITGGNNQRRKVRPELIEPLRRGQRRVRRITERWRLTFVRPFEIINQRAVGSGNGIERRLNNRLPKICRGSGSVVVRGIIVRAVNAHDNFPVGMTAL